MELIIFLLQVNSKGTMSETELPVTDIVTPTDEVFMDITVLCFTVCVVIVTMSKIAAIHSYA